MKRRMLFLAFLSLIYACEKEISLLPEYETMVGTWEIQSISYDSSGVWIIRELPYDRLVIESNLDYEIYSDNDDLAEHGSVEIITQTIDRLELYFAAERPMTSSFLGSYVFGATNVELITLTEDTLKFRTINASINVYSEREILLKR